MTATCDCDLLVSGSRFPRVSSVIVYVFQVLMPSNLTHTLIRKPNKIAIEGNPVPLIRSFPVLCSLFLLERILRSLSYFQLSRSLVPVRDSIPSLRGCYAVSNLMPTDCGARGCLAWNW